MNDSHSPSHSNLTSLAIAHTALAQVLKTAYPVFKLAWRAVLTLQLIEILFDTVSDVSTALATDAFHGTGKENLAVIAALAGVQLTFGLIWNSLWLLTVATTAHAIASGAARRPLIQTAAIYLNEIVIESVRSLAALLLRVPLLIVPALIEYIRLSLVPYVVVFDPAYQVGAVDALDRSRQLAKRRWLFLGLIVLASLSLPSAIDLLVLGPSNSILTTMKLATQSTQLNAQINAQILAKSILTFAVVATLKLIVNFVSVLFLYFVYRQLFERERTHASISVD